MVTSWWWAPSVWLEDGIHCSYFTIKSWWKKMMGHLPKADLCFWLLETGSARHGGDSLSRMPLLVSRLVSKCQQVALFHVTLGDIWQGSAGNVKETLVAGQTATFKSGFLGQSFVWSTRPPGWLSNGTEKNRPHLLRMKMAASSHQTSSSWMRAKWALALWRMWKCQQWREFGA